MRRPAWLVGRDRGTPFLRGKDDSHESEARGLVFLCRLSACVSASVPEQLAQAGAGNVPTNEGAMQTGATHQARGRNIRLVGDLQYRPQFQTVRGAGKVPLCEGYTEASRKAQKNSVGMQMLTMPCGSGNTVVGFQSTSPGRMDRTLVIKCNG